MQDQRTPNRTFKHARKRRGEEPNPVDVHVGKRLRQARLSCGLSQQQVGAQIQPALSYQQVQKYETGHNRISASYLWELARVLQCPVAYFFDGLDQSARDVLTLGAAVGSDVELLTRLSRPARKALRPLLLWMAEQDAKAAG